MIKKKMYLLGSLVIVSGGLLLGLYAISSEKVENKVENKIENKVLKDGSITKIQDLGQLKKDSNIIVEVIGTNENRVIDYKGVSCIITKVRVTDVIKGDKELKELNIIQVENVDVPPVDGEKLLMFLGKGKDNEGCYFPVGAGQGIYKISTETNTQPTKKALTIDEKIEPQSIVNDSILNDLKGNYKDIKEKLK